MPALRRHCQSAPWLLTHLSTTFARRPDDMTHLTCFPRSPRLLAAALLLAAHALPARSQSTEWRKDVDYLASDALRGRLTGSVGDSMAAAYIATAFSRAGLRPGAAGIGGDSTWFQTIGLESRRVDGNASRIRLVSGSWSLKLSLGSEVRLSPLSFPDSRVRAPLVFIGYGLSVPELGYDDLAGLDVRGKVVVFVTGGPPSLPGPLIAHHSNQRWASLRHAGAIGVLQVPNPRGMDMSWARQEASIRDQPTMALLDSALDRTAGAQVIATINPERADSLFRRSGHSFAQLMSIADSGHSLPHFDLEMDVEAMTVTGSVGITSRNVIGVLLGSDSILKHEFVVLTAHFDHLGVGAPVNGDSIYHGVMDNASGVAWLLQAARDFGGQHRRFRRSLLFLSTTAEEQFLLGSWYFARHPTVELSHVVANINIDAALPLFPLSLVLAHGLDESDLGDDLRRVCSARGLTAVNDPEPLRNGFVRSDQYSFVRVGVPVLSLKFGYALGSPEHQLVKNWRATRYHSPLDNLTQPMNRDAIDAFTGLYEAVIEAVANRESRAQWKPTSVFRSLGEQRQ
jgi:Zn-dependent M28 family amino/carboxypeptidase